MSKRDLEKLKKTTRSLKKTLADNYQVKRIGFFGSVARGDDTPKSDLDVLVEFKGPIGLFKFVELQRFLRYRLKKKVDLVSKKGLKRVIKKDILKETIYI